VFYCNLELILLSHIHFAILGRPYFPLQHKLLFASMVERNNTVAPDYLT